MQPADLLLSAHLAVQQGGFTLDIDLQVQRGSVLGLRGHNGCGKTTALRLLAGLDVPGAGSRIEMNGTTILDVDRGISIPTEKRSMAMVFVEPRLIHRLTALDNIAFGLRAHGVAKREARDVAMDLLERTGSEELANRRTGKLSAGQTARIALLQAIAIKPQLLLLDEPFTSLDVHSSSELVRFLRDELDSYGGSCIVAAHDRENLDAFTDDNLILDHGRVAVPASSAHVQISSHGAHRAALILAGGRSKRLGGVAKAGLMLKGRTLLERAIDAVTPSACTVVVGPARDLNVTEDPIFVQEDPPFGGPVRGLDAGMTALREHLSDADDSMPVVVMACDVPSCMDVITTLTAALAAHPQIDGVQALDDDAIPQPLLGIYRWGPLSKALEAHRSREGRTPSVRDVLGSMSIVTVPVGPGWADDIDTWEAAQSAGIDDHIGETS